MPGPYPGRVVSVKSDKCVDTVTGRANDEVVREMMARGMRALTGASTTADAWRRFFEPSDVVGIKVNCGGYPFCVSAYEIVAEVVRQLTGVGVPVVADLRLRAVSEPARRGELRAASAAKACRSSPPNAPTGTSTTAATIPATYLEADLFGEEDTRSNLMRLVSRRLTKIINIPNMKDHGATGVTGCLKNIAYGSFSNVARTHQSGKSHTYSFVGTLAAVEPLRSRTVLQIMDGLRGVWHGGPFARTTRYVFYPQPDPVRHRSGGDRSPAARHHRGASARRTARSRSGTARPRSLKIDDTRARDADPNVNIIIREPGHVEYASTLGLGVYDRAQIKVQDITV